MKREVFKIGFKGRRGKGVVLMVVVVLGVLVGCLRVACLWGRIVTFGRNKYLLSKGSMLWMLMLLNNSYCTHTTATKQSYSKSCPCSWIYRIISYIQSRQVVVCFHDYWKLIFEIEKKNNSSSLNAPNTIQLFFGTVWLKLKRNWQCQPLETITKSN